MVATTETAISVLCYSRLLHTPPGPAFVAILSHTMRPGFVLALAAAAQALAADFRTTGALTENVEDPVQIVFLVTVNASYTNNLHPSRLSGH